KQRQAAEAQGYAEGGFTKPGGKYEPPGIVHAGEWVASQKLLASPVARPMIEALDYAQRTNTVGSLRPDDVSRSITANNSLVRIAESQGGSALIVAAAARMSRTVDNLTDRLSQPFVTVNTVTGDKGIKQAQDEYSRLINNKSPKSRKNAANH
ncbi:MAG: phage tail tape measure protein, partial [Duncaniella sp.]|nr:phage tail tape measure protein [Duncaniella sp.]